MKLSDLSQVDAGVVHNVGAKAVSVGAVLSQIVAMFSAGFIVYTLLPSLIGAAVHTVLAIRSDEKELTPVDLITVSVIALCTGLWAGPWVADIMPSSDKGLPLFCFMVSLWAKDFMKMIKDGMTRILERSVK